MSESINKKVPTLAQMIAAHQKSNAKVSALADKVEALEATGGEANVITGVKVNGTEVEVTDKAVDITVPTKVSELENDEWFMTDEEVGHEIKKAVGIIRTEIVKTRRATFVKAAEVPDAADAEDNALYLVMNETTNHYDIYAKVYNNPHHGNFAATYGLELEEDEAKRVYFAFGNGFTTSIGVKSTDTMETVAQKLGGGMVAASGYTVYCNEYSGLLVVLDKDGERIDLSVTINDKLENGGELITPLVSAEVVLLDDTTVDLSGYETAEQTGARLDNKVDKEEGKGLSSNDYTDEDKEKLENKVDKVDGKGLSSNDYTDEEKEKLAGIEFASDEEVEAALAEIYGDDEGEPGSEDAE